MPRPRWGKLPSYKQQRILEAAAQAFAANGFEGASLNHILEVAEISKGAAYYYFDDKLDLFVTVVQHYADLVVGDFDVTLYELTRETFWPHVRAVYQRQLTAYGAQPWMLGAVKAARTVPREQLLESPLADLIQQISGSVTALLARGRALGAVRDDLTETLLVALFRGIDDAWDGWLVAQDPEMGRGELEQIMDQLVNLLERAMSPREESPP